MNSNPQRALFTIVTVSYNCCSLIEKTIKSVLQQDYHDTEYIIIDGESTDGTVEIIKKYAQHLAFWCSEPDGGIYQGMNKGISHAKGEWILFLNAGDVFAETTLRGNERVIKKALEPCNKQRMFFCHQAVFVRTELMKQYPYDTRFKMSADFYFFKFCYLTKKKFQHIPIVISVYDRTGISNTHRIAGLKENIQVIRELDKGWDKIKFLIKLHFVIYWNSIRTWIKKNRI